MEGEIERGNEEKKEKKLQQDEQTQPTLKEFHYTDNSYRQFSSDCKIKNNKIHSFGYSGLTTLIFFIHRN